MTPGVSFRVWGEDKKVYGPVDLSLLLNYAKEGRVTADTWIFDERSQAWQRGAQVRELQPLFESVVPPSSPGPDFGVSEQTAVFSRRPISVRRISLLADFTDQQLERFVQYMEVHRARAADQIVRQGQHGDAMFMVLEGGLRVRMMIEGKESVLVVLSPGEFFGEISLFDHGPRSADVVANQDSVLLKISAGAFQKLMKEAPDLAAPFLFSICKTLTARIRADNKRYRDAIQFARSGGNARPKGS